MKSKGAPYWITVHHTVITNKILFLALESNWDCEL